MKKLMILMVAVTLFATTGCARFWHHGGKGGKGGHGARLVQQQAFSTESLNEVVKDDNTQLVTLLK